MMAKVKPLCARSGAYVDPKCCTVAAVQYVVRSSSKLS